MTAKKQQSKEKEINLEPALRDSLWDQVLISIGRAKGLQEEGFLFEAVVVFQTRKFKLHLSKKLSWSQFQKVYEYAHTTISRYMTAGAFIEEWVLDRYKPTGNDPLLISEDMVREFVADRLALGKSISIRGINEEIKERREFLKYLTTGEGLSEAEFAKRMKLPKPPTHKSKAEPELPPPAENIIPFRERGNDDLFATHDRIISAGYTYEGETGRYLNRDNEEMSVEELSEFTDEYAGMMIFEETGKLLKPVRRELVSRIERHRIFYLAYSKKNPSPKFRELIEEKHKELEAEVIGILHEVSTMLKGLED